MKILLLLLKNNLIQLCRLNQLRYADNQKRRNTIYLYIFVGTILIGGLVYLSYSLNIVFSLSWTLDEIIINLILPVILICMILNVFISIFWGSGLLLSDTNIDNLLAFPVPLMVLIISKLSILYLVQAVLDMTLLFPMAVLFGLTADMKISYHSRSFGNDCWNKSSSYIEKLICSRYTIKNNRSCIDFICIYDIHVLQIS